MRGVVPHLAVIFLICDPQVVLVPLLEGEQIGIVDYDEEPEQWIVW